MFAAPRVASNAGRPDIAGDIAVRISEVTPFLVPDRHLQRALGTALAAIDPTDLRGRARLLARHAVIAEDLDMR